MRKFNTKSTNRDCLPAERCYLNGIDWIMVSLDMLNKKYTGLGNHSQLVLVLDGHLDKQVLQAELISKLSKSFFLRGRIKRAWNLAPYWESESLYRAYESELFTGYSDFCSGDFSLFRRRDFGSNDFRYKDIFNINTIKSGSQNKNCLDFLIGKCAGIPFKDDRTMLGFNLIYYGRYTYFIMRFDHRMFDARGAEALLELILNNDNNPGLDIPLPVQGPYLDSWKDKFLSGQRINRFLRKIYCKTNKDNEDVSEGFGLYSNQAGLSKVVKFGTHCFFYTDLSESNTATIEKNAVKTAGYLMDGIYVLGCAVKAFESLYGKERAVRGKMIIPVNVDMRGTKFGMEKIFLNRLSFMLFEVDQGLPLKDCIEHLKKQFIDQIKDKIPHHFINASLLMRIMPLKIISAFMDRKMRNLSCSFSFSYIGEQAFNLKTVHNLEVINLFHLPIVPVDTGIGVFFTRFNKRLNMVISSYNGIIDAENGRKLREKIISTMVMPVRHE